MTCFQFWCRYNDISLIIRLKIHPAIYYTCFIYVVQIVVKLQVYFQSN